LRCAGDAGELYCELVRGLGEALVGNWPGGALRFTAPKAALLPLLDAGSQARPPFMHSAPVPALLCAMCHHCPSALSSQQS
jgi:hypothetical protein